MGAVLAGAEDQRLAITIGRPVDAADEDDVIAPDHRVFGRAFEAGEGVVQKRTPAEPGPDREPPELVSRRGRETARDLALINAENIDRKVSGIEEARQRGGVAPQTPQDE